MNVPLRWKWNQISPMFGIINGSLRTLSHATAYSISSTKRKWCSSEIRCGTKSGSRRVLHASVIVSCGSALMNAVQDGKDLCTSCTVDLFMCMSNVGSAKRRSGTALFSTRTKRSTSLRTRSAQQDGENAAPSFDRSRNLALELGMRGRMGELRNLEKTRRGLCTSEKVMRSQARTESAWWTHWGGRRRWHKLRWELVLKRQLFHISIHNLEHNHTKEIEENGCNHRGRAESINRNSNVAVEFLVILLLSMPNSMHSFTSKRHVCSFSSKFYWWCRNIKKKQNWKNQ